MTTIGPSQSTTATTRVDVPTWNGEADRLTSYKFEINMFMKSIKVADRYVCGPQLVRVLGASVRMTVENCPDINDVDEIDKNGNLVGWNRVLDYVLQKLDYTSLNDTGLLAEEFFVKIARNSDETFQDWAARFEKKERELLTQLKAIDGGVEEATARPLRTWWFLSKSRLTPVQRGEITATTRGDYDYAKTYKTLLTRFPAEALAELDGKTRRDKVCYDEEYDEAEDEIGGEHYDEIVDVVEQLINLAEEDEEEDEAADGHSADSEVFAEFKQVGQSFKDARDLLRRLRTSRDYYPVVATKDERERRTPSPPAPGRGHFRPTGGRGRFGGCSRHEAAHGCGRRDLSKMKCVACHEYGHRAVDCPRRNTKGQASGAQGSAHNGSIPSALNEYMYLLERDGIWAVLDIGATQSLGGVEGIENLMYEMLVDHGEEFETDSEACSFTFGDGLSKSSMGTVTGNVFLGGDLFYVRLSVMPNRVPILLGMDILSDCLKMVVDCGQNWIGLPTLGNKVFYCERLSSNRMAVNVSTPQWWKEAPFFLPNPGCLATESDDPKVLIEELAVRNTCQSDGNIDGASTYQSDGNTGAARIGESDGNPDIDRFIGSSLILDSSSMDLLSLWDLNN
ncbi:unnamed protein product [Prorocentrum cordatum]|uniref:CCHC-type domain-containing protein n=1 Tax=Prorocentrum cordatum TaxID=2364126 RepID=A0ABN9TZJ6_9DINO|nr:unnamed protein product [Polarella glacialis]